MSYWLISVPNGGSNEKALFDQNQAVTRSLSKNVLFRVPGLKVGTLDSLMSLSDDLAKHDVTVGAIAKKIEKTYFDLSKSTDGEEKKSSEEEKEKEKKKSAEAESLKIGSQSAREFIEKFSWNETRYPKRSPLRTLTELIVKEASKSDESLKKQVAEYNEIRQAFAAIDRRDTGSLLVKSLAPYVKEKDVIDKGHLTTLIIVVPRTKMLEFEEQYETMEDAQLIKEEGERQRKLEDAKARADDLAKKYAALSEEKKEDHHEEKEHETADELAAKKLAIDAAQAAAEAAAQKVKEVTKANKPLPCRIVVPRSIKKLFDDGKDEFVLYRVLCMKEGQETIKNICRERRYVIRPYKHDPAEEKAEAEKKIELAKKRKALWNYLLRWCSTTYSEVFAAWIHLKTIRLFVESVLRYGLPVSFTAILMEPVPRKEQKLRAELLSLYFKLSGGQANLSAAAENEPEISGITTGEFYPYVYLPVSLLD